MNARSTRLASAVASVIITFVMFEAVASLGKVAPPATSARSHANTAIVAVVVKPAR